MPYITKIIIWMIIITMIPAASNTAGAAITTKPITEDQKMGTDIIADFALYSSFLTETRVKNAEYVSINAKNKAQAIAYLSAGFIGTMPADIVNTFTIYSASNEQLIIIPQEGLPVPDEKELSRAEYCLREDTDIATAVCRLDNCFQPADSYVYKIWIKKDDKRWKIFKLELYEEQPGHPFLPRKIVHRE